MASLRPDTGVSRGPQRYGAAEKDSDRDALRDELRRFEALAEPGNEEHQQVSGPCEPCGLSAVCAAGARDAEPTQAHQEALVQSANTGAVW